MRVKRFIDYHYPTLLPDELATHARALMRDLALSVLPVVSNNRVVGIVKRHHVLTLTSTKSNALVSDIMEVPQIVFKDLDDVRKAIRIMIEFNEWYVPVVDGRSNKYLGMITLSSYIRIAGRSYLDIAAKIPVDEVMMKNVEYVLPDDYISKLWKKIITLRISGFPVVKSRRNLKVIGIITEHDLLRKGYTRIELESERGPRKGIKVRDAMTSPAITLKLGEGLNKAINLMIDKEIGRIPVVNNEGMLRGIIDRSSVCKALLRI